MNIQILYQDDAIVVINKPSGLLSVPYEGCSAKTAIQILENMMRKNGTYSKNHRPFAVHRLDRDTSGVMVFALNENIQKKMMNNWQSIVTERLYVAVSENGKGKKIDDAGTIDSPLSFNAYHVGYVAKGKDKNAKSTVGAVTHYKVIARGKFYTMFELDLETGKKNQIRAHLSSIGFPIAGDKNFRAKTDPFGRLALHARSLEFFHPVTNKKLKFEVDQGESWLKVVTGSHKD